MRKISVFSCKTKVGRDNSGRAELPRTGPIKTKPINSGGIPNVSPTTVVNQTFRKSRPVTQAAPPRKAGGHRRVLGLFKGSQQNMENEGKRAVTRVATYSHQLIRQIRLEP